MSRQAREVYSTIGPAKRISEPGLSRGTDRDDAALFGGKRFRQLLCRFRPKNSRNLDAIDGQFADPRNTSATFFSISAVLVVVCRPISVQPRLEGKIFEGFRSPSGLKTFFTRIIAFEVGVIEHEVHEFLLLVSDAVFAAERTTGSDAYLHDVSTHVQDLVHLVLPPASKRINGWRLPSPAWKTFATGKPYRSEIRSISDSTSGSWVRGNDGIHDDHVGTDAAHGAERAFAAQPQPRALLIVLCDTHFVSPIPAANLDDRIGVSSRPSRNPSTSISSAARIARITGLVNGSFHGFDRLVVHEFERRGHDPCRNHVRDRLTAVLDRMKRREQRLHGLRFRRRRTMISVTIANVPSDPTIAPTRSMPTGSPAGLPSRTISPSDEHRFNRENVIRRHAVLQAVRAAGVLRNVTADAAGHLARRIRRVVQTERRGRLRDVEVHDTGLHDRDAILDIDRQDPVHPLHLDDDPAFGRHGAAAEACPGTAWQKRNGYSLAISTTAETCSAVLRENDGFGFVLEQSQRVALVDEQFGLVCR